MLPSNNWSFEQIPVAVGRRSDGRWVPVGWPLGAGQVAAGRRSGAGRAPVGRWSGAGRAPEVSILVKTFVFHVKAFAKLADRPSAPVLST